MSRIRDILLQSRAALKQARTLDDREAGLEAHILLGHALGQSRAWLLAHGDDPIAPAQRKTFDALLERRLRGEPVAYILGHREFFGLDLQVTDDVLIPRPETELLVELALALIPEQAAWDVLDLGTGSGALAIAIAKHRPHARITAIEKSAAAVEVARNNALRLGVRNIRFLEGDWFTPLESDSRFNVIVSNPPYVAEADPHLARGDLRYEPRAALASGGDGLDDIRSIASHAAKHLLPGGWLLLEHGFEQGEGCRNLMRKYGLSEVASHRDLAGLERVTTGRRGT